MSTRGYRITQLEWRDDPAFNLNSEELEDWTIRHQEILTHLNDDCCGMTYVPRKALEEILDMDGIGEEVKETIREDLASTDDDEIRYMCL